MKTSTHYLRLLQSLLPQGAAWNKEEGSSLSEFLFGQAEEFSRVDGRSDDLLVEKDTRYSSELLIDHEIDLGLPGECSPESQTIAERRLAAHTKLITLGQQNPAYFIELAAAYGWMITINEFSPMWCGVGVAGDMCGDQDVIFYWEVVIFYTGDDIIYFTAGSSEAGDALSFLPAASSLICMLNKYKPAHTTIIYSRSGFAFDSAFSTDFNSLSFAYDEETYLTGPFDQSFSQAFDTHLGGAFDFDSFGGAFNKPRYAASLEGAFGKDFGLSFDNIYG